MFQGSSENEKAEHLLFNQDTIRDNFSSITVALELIFDGISGPGGALPNSLVLTEAGHHLMQNILRKSVRIFGYASDAITSASQTDKARNREIRAAIGQSSKD